MTVFILTLSVLISRLCPTRLIAWSPILCHKAIVCAHVRSDIRPLRISGGSEHAANKDPAAKHKPRVLKFTFIISLLEFLQLVLELAQEYQDHHKQLSNQML